jgi:hypothetical protein
MSLWDFLKSIFVRARRPKDKRAVPVEQQPPAKRKPPAPVVRVWYLDEDSPVEQITQERGGGYAYYWRVEGSTPTLGQRVIAPVMSGYGQEAVIVGFGRDGYKGRIKSITRLAK